jgi:hypothetical protein
LKFFDPCGLIEGGAPADEYDCLTEKLPSNVYNRMSRKELEELILYEIEHHFGLPGLTGEPCKSQFYSSLDKLLSDIEKTFTQNDKTN